jgi:hypothetical protein
MPTLFFRTVPYEAVCSGGPYISLEVSLVGEVGVPETGKLLCCAFETDDRFGESWSGYLSFKEVVPLDRGRTSYSSSAYELVREPREIRLKNDMMFKGRDDTRTWFDFMEYSGR